MTKRELLVITQRIQRNRLLIEQCCEILELEDGDMPVSADVAALNTAFDSATDAVAARLQRLIDRPNVGLTADDKAAFQKEIDRLNIMGKDPAGPGPGPTT